MSTSTQICQHCGSTLIPGSKFCNDCGAKVSAGPDCPHCNKAVTPGAKFCIHCGKDILGEPEVASGSRWVRRSSDFATRIEMTDLSAWVKRGITVDEGTRALLFQHGAYVGMLEPGLHPLETVLERLKSLVVASPCSVVLIDAGSVELQVNTPKLRTKDDQEIDATIKTVVNLDKAMPFYTNLLKGGKSITTGDLASHLQQEILAVMQSIILECSATELYGNQELSLRIEDEIREALAASVSRYGLNYQSIKFVTFGETAFDAIRQERGEILIDEEKNKLKHQRLSLTRKFDELMTKEKMAEIQNQADFDDFCKQVEQETGIKDLLRQQEKEELWRQYKEKKEDHEIARKHVLAILDWQQKKEELNHELSFKRNLLAGRQELDEEKKAHEINMLNQAQAAQLSRLYEEHQHNLKVINETRNSDLDHETKVEKARIDQLRDKGKLGIELQEDWERIKEGRADKSLDRDIKKTTAEQSIKQKDEDAAHAREMDKYDKLGTLSTEALIAATDSDKAKMLAELKETEILKGMTEEQILARAAENSPQVAQAFAEKFKASANEKTQDQMKEMYERMLEAKDKSSEQMATTQQENAKMLKEIMETALQTQRDTSVAASQGPTGQGPSVIYPPPGSGPSTVVNNQQPNMLVCPRCNAQSPAGSAFCGECGHSFQ